MQIYKSVRACKIITFFFLLSIVVIGVDSVYAAAPVATIYSPQNNEILSKDSNITFLGSGADAEDGDLSGGRLVWISDRDGPLGKGEQFSTYLSNGAHTITLTVTDSSELSGSTQITIVVEGIK